LRNSFRKSRVKTSKFREPKPQKRYSNLNENIFKLQFIIHTSINYENVFLKKRETDCLDFIDQ